MGKALSKPVSNSGRQGLAPRRHAVTQEPGPGFRCVARHSQRDFPLPARRGQICIFLDNTPSLDERWGLCISAEKILAHTLGILT